MSKRLRVLQIEDSESDAALIVRLLEKDGYDVHAERVETAEQMRRVGGAELGGHCRRLPSAQVRCAVSIEHSPTDGQRYSFHRSVRRHWRGDRGEHNEVWRPRLSAQRPPGETCSGSGS